MSLNKTFAALADPTRRKILTLLKRKELSVNEMAINFDITLPSLSHHLTILKNAGLISYRRRGQQLIYSLNLSIFEEVAKELYNFFNKKI
ncbi:MAG: autorepressor SdpR family transcription factor [Patescibacteria group bacterium]|jgi:DNA-binding transcriptional ArsR family regulator|nr:autorepressor SdpR family transcription factor [Patescibacteria group bacterium]